MLLNSLHEQISYSFLRGYIRVCREKREEKGINRELGLWWWKLKSPMSSLSVSQRWRGARRVAKCEGPGMGDAPIWLQVWGRSPEKLGDIVASPGIWRSENLGFQSSRAEGGYPALEETGPQLVDWCLPTLDGGPSSLFSPLIQMPIISRNSLQTCP